MKKNHLNEINGDKIRWQYFTWPILILIFCMLFAPYCILIISLFSGNFNLSNWFSDLLVSVEICLVLSIPYIVLSILNRCFFGKVICVVNEHGIHYKDGLLKWNDITKIEYKIALPSKLARKENLFCHTVIFTKKENIKLIHTPIFFISKVKKYNPSLDAKVSNTSKWMIVFIIVSLIAIPIIFEFFPR